MRTATEPKPGEFPYDLVRSAADLSRADPRIRRFWDYTQDCRRDGKWPERRHFDPTAIPGLLRYIWIMDVAGEPEAYRFRLVGTSVVAAFGFDPTGQPFVEVMNDRFAKSPNCLDRYAETVQACCATWRKGAARLGRNVDFQSVENLCVPFAAGGDGVAQLVSLSLCRSIHGTEY